MVPIRPMLLVAAALLTFNVDFGSALLDSSQLWRMLQVAHKDMTMATASIHTSQEVLQVDKKSELYEGSLSSLGLCHPVCSHCKKAVSRRFSALCPDYCGDTKEEAWNVCHAAWLEHQAS